MQDLLSERIKIIQSETLSNERMYIDNNRDSIMNCFVLTN